MNEYMLNNKNNNVNLEKEKYKEKDEKLIAMKRKGQSKKESPRTLEEHKKMANIFGSLSAVLFLVCFIMGAGLIQNDDRISELEQRLLKLDKSYKYILSQVKDDNVKSVFAESDKQSLTINTSLTEQTTQTTTQNIANTTKETTTLSTENSQTTTEKPKYKTYEIKDGDSLEAISKKIYGDRNKIEEIMELNGITNPHKIYSGMIINIP